MRRDTTYRAHSDIREECILLHDSVRAELSRLAMSKPRTYKEVLILKERFSSYTGDVELHRSAEEIRPFFAELDKRPACRGNKEQILSAYRNVLAEALNNGIHGNGDLKNSSKGRMPLFELSCPGCTSLAKRIWPTSPVTQRNAAPRCFRRWAQGNHLQGRHDIHGLTYRPSADPERACLS